MPITTNYVQQELDEEKRRKLEEQQKAQFEAEQNALLQQQISQFLQNNVAPQTTVAGSDQFMPKTGDSATATASARQAAAESSHLPVPEPEGFDAYAPPPPTQNWWDAPAPTPQDILAEPDTEFMTQAETVVNDQIARNPQLQEPARLLGLAAESTNETERAVPQVAEDLALKMIRQRLEENTPYDQLAEQYEKELKATPWYEDNRLWGAALGFGIGLLGGADLDESLVLAGMSGLQTQNLQRAELDRLRAIDKEREEIYRTREQGLEDAEIGRLAELADAEQAAMDELNKTVIKASFDAAKDSGMPKPVLDTFMNRIEDNLDAIEDISSRRNAVNENMFRLGTAAKLTPYVDERGRVKYKTDMNPGAVGAIDNPLNIVGGIFGFEDAVDRQMLVTAINNWITREGASLKGAQSDRDMAIIRNQLPGPGSSDEAWDQWFKAYIRINEQIQDQLDRSHLSKYDRIDKLTSEVGSSAKTLLPTLPEYLQSQVAGGGRTESTPRAASRGPQLETTITPDGKIVMNTDSDVSRMLGQ